EAADTAANFSGLSDLSDWQAASRMFVRACVLGRCDAEALSERVEGWTASEEASHDALDLAWSIAQQAQVPSQASAG
ncbi:unnamed protein product, partial [Effrenium voratum]